jgi:flavodoxin
MKVRVFYGSETGNTKRVAQAIAEALGCAAEPADAAAPSPAADILFLGGAVYATQDHGIRPEVARFIAGLDPAMIGKVALFRTGFSDAALGIMADLLAGRGIPVAEERFGCKGRFLFFNLGHPNDSDLEAAREFALRIVADGKDRS